MKTKNIKTIVIGLIVVAVLVAGMLFVLDRDQTNFSEPLTAGELNVQLGVEREEYAYGDTVVFKSAVENISAEAHKYTFNTTCTQGNLFINNQRTQTIQVCGQAITDVELSPGERVSYEYEFTLVREFSRSPEGDHIEYDGELKLLPGTHEARLEWQGVQSKSVQFSVSEK